jgi:hypothetical protein
MAATGENPATETKGPAATPKAPNAGQPQYEFSTIENKLIRNLAAKMHFVGLFSISIGVLLVAIGGLLSQVSIVHALGPIFTGTFSALLGLWIQRASVSFKKIADTEGRDVAHLIAALEDLKRFFTLTYWLCILMLTVAILALVLVFWKGPGYL